MADNKQSNNNAHAAHHIVPLKVYYRVFAALIVGTIITVAASYVDFGAANTVIAMVIATAKALLVILFFMGLKYDGQENNVTFFMTPVFLAIFITLTSADILYRRALDPVRVDASELPQPSEPVDVNKLRFSTPELIAKGKVLYGQQCITCHGANGQGDGPAAAALTPRPRNFTTNEWKQGGSPAKVFKTLTIGVPGTPMPPFSGLSVEERFALAHYVRTFASNPPSPNEDTPEVIASLGIGGPTKPRISIERAMEKMAEPE